MSVRQEFERDCAPQGIAMVHYDEKTGKYSPNDSKNSTHINIAFSANTALWAYQAAHKAQQAEIGRLRAALKQAQIFVDGVFEQEQQPTLAAAQVGRIIAKALEGNQ